MGKKLAIKGHSTRGNEVIELLEMLGGYADDLIDNGTDEKYAYFIVKDENNVIDAFQMANKNGVDFDTRIFTLEEFLEKFPFKVGDVIRFPYSKMVEEIAEMEWDEELEDIIYTSVSGTKRPCSVPKNTNNETNAKTDCKKCCIHGSVSNPVESKSYAVSLKDGEVIDNSIDAAEFMQFGKTVAICFNTENYEDKVELQLGDYEIEVRDGKTYAVRKKPKYPTTYEECCNILDDDERMSLGLVIELRKLIDARNAYWKIAGEQMGLGKPWKPDFNSGQFIPAIVYKGGFIQKVEIRYSNAILAFPTVEMRNDFKENFDKDIEICKELL